MTGYHFDINEAFVSPAEFVDSDHGSIRKFAAERLSGCDEIQDQARVLFLAVRDEIRYEVYLDYTVESTFRASSVLESGQGYCVGKAALFCALCRAAGIPARIGLADVRNHLGSPRLREIVGTDLFVLHGYVELLVEGRWLKATPTFNASLCKKLGVRPLDFDGHKDALLQAFDAEGRTFMEYVRDYGTFYDVPTDFLMTTMARCYPALCCPGGIKGSLNRDPLVTTE